MQVEHRFTTISYDMDVGRAMVIRVDHHPQSKDRQLSRPLYKTEAAWVIVRIVLRLQWARS